MNTPSRFWADWTHLDFDQLDASNAIALLPLGATEQHGPHLPLSVDTVLVEGIVNHALNHLNPDDTVLVMPTQSVSYSIEHSAFSGTLSYSPASIIEQWCAIGQSVAQVGIQKMVLFNSHGGNTALMDIVARQLRAQFKMLVFGVNWYQLPLAQEVTSLFSEHEHRFGIHAGDMETSLMMALAPQLVRHDQLQNFHSASEDRAKQFSILGNGKSAKLGWHIQDYNSAGAVGNAQLATPAKGQALLDSASKQLAMLLQEVAQMSAPISEK